MAGQQHYHLRHRPEAATASGQLDRLPIEVRQMIWGLIVDWTDANPFDKSRARAVQALILVCKRIRDESALARKKKAWSRISFSLPSKFMSESCLVKDPSLSCEDHDHTVRFEHWRRLLSFLDRPYSENLLRNAFHGRSCLRFVRTLTLRIQLMVDDTSDPAFLEQMHPMQQYRALQTCIAAMSSLHSALLIPRTERVPSRLRKPRYINIDKVVTIAQFGMPTILDAILSTPAIRTICVVPQAWSAPSAERKAFTTAVVDTAQGILAHHNSAWTIRHTRDMNDVCPEVTFGRP